MSGQLQTLDTPPPVSVQTLLYGIYQATSSGSGSSSSPIDLAYSATLSPVYGDGVLRTCTLTGNATLNVPSGASAGNVWTGVFTASGAARDITLAAGFKTPTGATYTATIASGSIRVIESYYTGSVWLVTRNQEFVP